MEEALRQLPNSQKGEKIILSGMMQWPDLVSDATELGVTIESLYVPAHGIILGTIRNLQKSGSPVDLNSVHQSLKDSSMLDNIGGSSYLAEIYSYAPTSANFKHWCKDVVSKYRLRLVISKCTSNIEKAYKNPKDVDEFLDSVERDVLSIERGYESDDDSDLKSLMEGSIKRLEGFIRGDIEIEGLATRFKVLNDLTRGFKPGEMIVIAARPSMGKTALLCNLVEDFTIEGVPGLVFSCEMSNAQVMDRILFGRAKFPMHYMKKGFLPTREELKSIQNAAADISGNTLFIDDTPAINIDQARAKIRRKKKSHDIKYAAVDYLQLMTGHDKKNREREIAEISAGLKSIAKELKIPVIVLAQINRNAERRTDGIPKMSDLRESGSVEQDSDLVGLLYRPDYYKKPEEEEERKADSRDALRSNVSHATLIIAKNRHGPTGEVEMKFHKEIMEFV